MPRSAAKAASIILSTARVRREYRAAGEGGQLGRKRLRAAIAGPHLGDNRGRAITSLRPTRYHNVPAHSIPLRIHHRFHEDPEVTQDILHRDCQII